MKYFVQYWKKKSRVQVKKDFIANDIFQVQNTINNLGLNSYLDEVEVYLLTRLYNSIEY